VGVTTLRRLIVADGAQNILKAALSKAVSLKAEDDVKRIAFLMDKYRFHVLPVVDAAGVLVGIITIDDIFSRLVTLAFRRAIRRKEVAS
jgi:magnesium transporter